MAALADDLLYALDGVTFSQAALGVVLDPWQRDVVCSNAGRQLLLCCRQSGKSTTSAGLAMHTALYHAGALILIVSPSERQSKELFRKCIGIYRALGRPVAPETENKLALELVNGSRVVALPGQEHTIRSFSGVDLILEDEAARVDDDLYAAVRPMLAVSAGRLVLLSTPWGRRGHFYDAWEHGGDDWERVKITAAECPRIPAAFLEEERRALPELRYRSEYLVEFTDVEDGAFATADIDAAFVPTVTPLFAGDLMFTEPRSTWSTS